MRNTPLGTKSQLERLPPPHCRQHNASQIEISQNVPRQQTKLDAQKSGPIAKTSQEAIIKCSLTEASWNLERKIQSLQKQLYNLDAHCKDLLQHK